MLEPTERVHDWATGLHRKPAREILSTLVDAQLASLRSLRRALPGMQPAAEALAAVMVAGGRVGFAGAGSSGLMALAERLEFAGTFGIPVEATPICFAGGAEALLEMRGHSEDDLTLAEADLARSGLTAGDALVAVSASGSTPYTLQIARLARQSGVIVVGIANVEGSALLTECDHPILLETGPELIAGSTRMAAATAQKIALNAISVLIGIRLGHVHDGYMVNLRAENAKLVRRAAKIVAEIAGVPVVAAQEALAEADGEVKLAILVARGQPVATAREALKTHNGHLEKLFEALSQGPEVQQRRRP